MNDKPKCCEQFPLYCLEDAVCVYLGQPYCKNHILILFDKLQQGLLSSHQRDLMALREQLKAILEAGISEKR